MWSFSDQVRTPEPPDLRSKDLEGTLSLFIQIGCYARRMKSQQTRNRFSLGLLVTTGIKQMPSSKVLSAPYISARLSKWFSIFYLTFFIALHADFCRTALGIASMTISRVYRAIVRHELPVALYRMALAWHDTRKLTSTLSIHSPSVPTASCRHREQF